MTQIPEKPGHRIETEADGLKLGELSERYKSGTEGKREEETEKETLSDLLFTSRST